MTAITDLSDLSDLDNIAQHLLIQLADVHVVRRLHGRALCYQLELTDGRRFFVKQARRVNRETPGPNVILREARAVEAVHQVKGLAGIAPAILTVDEQHSVAVYRGHQHWQPLGDLMSRPGGVSLPTYAALGAALARLHAVHPGDDRTDEPFSVTGSFGRPTTDWITVTPRSLAAFPSGYREVWARTTQAREALEALANRWRTTSLVHGDIKSDNILVSPDNEAMILLVDWETAGWGDPLWDVGNLVGDIVSTWLQTLQLTPGGTLQSWLGSSRLPFENIRAQVRTILDAYAAWKQISDRDRNLIVQYAGCYLLQRALAEGTQTEHLNARAVLTTSLVTQFLNYPDRTAEVLL